jgi:Bacterial CdiA-CT RNAse A domain
MAGADLRNVDALLHLRDALLRFRDATSGVAGQLRTRIDRAETALARQMSRLRSEIEEQQAILSRSRDDEERADARQAIRDAQEELGDVRRRARALSAVVVQYKRAVPSWHRAMQDGLPTAAAFLAEKHAQAVDIYRVREPSALDVGVTSASNEVGTAGSSNSGLRSLLLPMSVAELRMAANDSDLLLIASEEGTKAHPIKKHVGKSDLYLAIRLAKESDGASGPYKERGIAAASTFVTDVEQAAAVSKALTDPKNVDKLDKWVNGGWCSQRRLPLTTDFSGGRVLRRGKSESENGTEALVLLRRLETGEIVVWTAYPRPRRGNR